MIVGLLDPGEHGGVAGRPLGRVHAAAGRAGGKRRSSEVGLAGPTRTPPAGRRLRPALGPRLRSAVLPRRGVELHRDHLSGRGLHAGHLACRHRRPPAAGDGVAFVAADEPVPEIEVRGVAGRPAASAGSSGIHVLYGDRHVAEVAQQPGDGRCRAHWSSPRDRSRPAVTLVHVVELDGSSRGPRAAVVGAHSPVWRRAGDWRVATSRTRRRASSPAPP